MKNSRRGKQWLSLFTGALLAGVAIGVGGTVFLSVSDSVAGSLLFTVGLFVICLHRLNLFTGKVGYLVGKPKAYLADLLIIWLGNLAGTGISGAAVRQSRISAIAERAQGICTVKMNDDMLSLFLLAIFCGLLMYAAVEGYKTSKQPLILFACVSAFILCGFEHCIADMYYFSVAGMWSADAFLRVLVITLGNTLGGILIPLGALCTDRSEENT